MIATPGAQEIGEHTFDYSLIPAPSREHSWEQAVYNQAYAFTAPMRAVSTSLHGGQLNAKAQLVQVSDNRFVISTIKAWEHSSSGSLAWLVRGYNPTGVPLEISITPGDLTVMSTAPIWPNRLSRRLKWGCMAAVKLQ
jgi:alpha-mannosidase